MEEIKRKASKILVNDKEYMAIRVDLRNPLSALWLLEQARDQIKTSIYVMQSRQREEEKKFKIEKAKADTKNFVQGL